MKKPKKVIKINKSSMNRIKVIGLLLFLILFVLIFRIAYIQFIDGPNLSKLASSQQTSTKTIEPSRGIIYDSNGKVLAVSAEVDTVSVNPSRLKYDNGNEVDLEFVARIF